MRDVRRTLSEDPSAFPAPRMALTRRPDPHPTAPARGQGRALEPLSRLLALLPLPDSLRQAVAEHTTRLTKYFAGSVIAGVVSMATFVVTFGPGLLGSKGASLAGSATGAIVNYFLNRNWTWERRGRAHLRRELVPYWTTVLLTALAAALVTSTVNAVVRGITPDRGIRTVCNTIAFIGTYVASFGVKYGVFNRVFSDSRTTGRQNVTAREADEGSPGASREDRRAG